MHKKKKKMNPTMPDDFYKNEFFKQLAADIKSMRRDLRENTRETKKINSRVTKLEAVSHSHDEEPVENVEDLPIWWKDSQLMGFLKLLLIAGIVATVAFVLLRTGVNLLDGLPR